jgi:IclR family KDG regulon transcriptional repressor
VTELARSAAAQVRAKQASQSVIRALELVDVMASHKEPVGLQQLAREMGRPPSSVHRLLRSLELPGYVENQDGSYRLTLKFAAIGNRVLEGLDMVREAQASCEDLLGAIDETVHMSVRSDTYVVYVAKYESERSIRIISRLGMHIPMYCTAMGKVFLAYLPDAQREDILNRVELEARTRLTICDRKALAEQLATIVRRGWALDNEEFDYGIVCIGAPIFDDSNRIAAAISITAPPARLTSADIPRVAHEVTKTAAAISRRLGAIRPAGASFTSSL